MDAIRVKRPEKSPLCFKKEICFHSDAIQLSEMSNGGNAITHVWLTPGVYCRLYSVQIFVLGVPDLVLSSDPQTSSFVRSVITWMSTLAVIVLIFGNLMFKTT